jgi:hypothetical protein
MDFASLLRSFSGESRSVIVLLKPTELKAHLCGCAFVVRTERAPTVSDKAFDGGANEPA